MATNARRNVIYKALGLFTYGNQFDAPVGAMASANNVVIDRPGVVESRPGFVGSSWTLPVGANCFAAPFQPADATRQYAMCGATFLATSGTTYAVNPGYGVVMNNTLISAVLPDGNVNTIGEVFSSFRANGNDYFVSGGKVKSGNITSNLGKVMRRDYNSSGSPNTCRNGGAGAPQGLTPVDYAGTAGSGLTGLTTAASTPLASGGQVAYRVLFANKDKQNNLVRGVPSGRHIVFSSGAYTYGLIIPLPVGQLFAGDIVQIYRSEVASATAGTEPSDNMFQVGEYIIQASDVSSFYITFQDKVTAAYGPALYTNDTQDGIAMAEAPPPDCAFGVYHKNVAWYGGVQAKGQTVTFSILGLAGWSTGVGTETQFTINGQTYKAATTEDLPNKKFKLATAGSAGQNIADTARSIARVISYNNTELYAYYATPASSIQFSIVLKTSYGVGTAGSINTYTFSAANLPSGTISPAPSFDLKPEGKTSRIYYSKPSQPEAVPDLNYLSVGAPDADVCGMASLRDSLFVFKTDGLYRITGTTAADIRVELFDPTVKMNPGHHGSIAIAGNQIFALVNQGVVAVTESGVNVISRPIEDLVLPYAAQVVGLGDTPDGNMRYVFPSHGVACDESKRYVLTVNNPNDGVANMVQKTFCYNFIEQAWTQWSYATNITGAALTATSAGKAIVATTSAGNGLYAQWQTYNASPTYATGASFSYCVEDEENPLVLKRFYDVRLALTGSSGLSTISCTFSSDSGASPATVTQSVGTGQYSVVFEVPKDHAQCGQLTFTVTAPNSGRMVVQTCSVSYDVLSDRIPGSRG